jgi:PEGA domain
MARRLRRSLLAIAWLTCVSAPALAQSNDAPDPTTEAGKRAEGKVRYERGAQAYAAGHFKDAIDLFLQADALAPSAALSFNIARAYEKIGDDAATLQWYRDFRRRAPDAKNGPEVDQRVHAFERALAKKGVQQVTILSRPLGATVIVDDKPRGVTPFTGQFAPGTHEVLLSLKGYADSEQELDLPADHAQELEVPLVPVAEGEAAPPRAVAAAAPTAAAGARPVQPTPAHDAAAGPKFGIWPWVGLGAGVAALGGSLAFELSRRSAENDASADKTQVGFKDKLDSEQSRQTTARVLAAVGGTLAIAGGTLLVIELSSDSTSEHAEMSSRVGFGCLPGACNVQVRGSF